MPNVAHVPWDLVLWGGLVACPSVMSPLLDVHRSRGVPTETENGPPCPHRCIVAAAEASRQERTAWLPRWELTSRKGALGLQDPLCKVVGGDQG